MTVDPARSVRLADLTAGPVVRFTVRGFVQGAVVFAVAIVVSSVLGHMLAELQARYQETHGVAGLDHPGLDECAVARAVLAEHKAGDARSILAPGPVADRVVLRTRAYSARVLALAPPGGGPGRPAPANDADWRWCPGFAGFARGLGLRRLGDWSSGPRFSISRPIFSGDGEAATAYVDYAPGNDDHGSHDWDTQLRRDPASGVWRVVGRTGL